MEGQPREMMNHGEGLRTYKWFKSSRGSVLGRECHKQQGDSLPYLRQRGLANSDRTWRLCAAVVGKGVKYSLVCMIGREMTITLFKHVVRDYQLVNCT